MSRSDTTSSNLVAGVARRDITVDDPAVAVHDRLYAKALVLGEGQTRSVVLVLDAVAIGGICDVSEAFLPALRQRIERELGIPGDHVLVSATHTHPPGRLLCDDTEQVARCFAAVQEAAENLTPVRVGVGRGHEDRIAMNRNVTLRGGGQWTVRHSNPSPPDEQVESLGRIDPEIGIVRLDRLDGRPLAVLFNYACHPLLGVPSQAVTANFPGFACRLIEEAMGHDATALFLQGAAGDVIETTFKDRHRPMHSEPVGQTLALSTLAAYRKIEMRPEASLAMVSHTVRLPRRTDSEAHIQKLLEQQQVLLDTLRFTSMNFKAFLPMFLEHRLSPEFPSDEKYRYLQEQQIGRRDLIDRDAFNRRNVEKYLANIHAMEQLARIQDELATYRRHQDINRNSGETEVDAQVQGLRIGPAVIVTAPIELLNEVGLRVKQDSPHDYTFVAAFANGYLHYGAPAEDYELGGYEVIECLLAPGWRSIYEDAAQQVLQKL